MAIPDKRIFKNCMEVRYAETDKSGIVAMQNYLTWLDLARDGFFEYMGIPYNCSMEAKGYLLMLADYHIDFNRRVYYGETVDLYSAVSYLSSKRVIITHRIYLQGEDPMQTTPVCEAFAKLAFVSRETYHSVHYDEEDPEVFGRLKEFLMEEGFSSNGGLV